MTGINGIICATESQGMAAVKEVWHSPHVVEQNSPESSRETGISDEGSLVTEADEFRIVSSDFAPSPWVQLEDEPIQFQCREDGRHYMGQLVRRVELLGREYVIVRAQTLDNLADGKAPAIRIFGMGYEDPQNNDIVMSHTVHGFDAGCDSACRDSFNRMCTQQTGTTTDSSSPSCFTVHVDESGIFVPDTKRFQRGHLLGSGGFGDVYQYSCIDAMGSSTHEDYAVKEIDFWKLALRCEAEPGRLVRWIARLEFEVRNQLKLSGHPAVVTVHDAFVYRSRFYIVMDLVHGVDLGRRLQNFGRLSEPEARHIFEKVAEALRHSHALDVVHRDCKPENIVLEKPAAIGGRPGVKLVDFGLSKDLSGSWTGAVTPFLGTKAYMAPEVRQSTRGQESCDLSKVDVFALGTTLFAMLGGKRPPEGIEVTELTFRGAAWQRVSAEARDLLLGMLRHDVERRLCLGDVIDHPWLKCRPDPDRIVSDTGPAAAVSSAGHDAGILLSKKSDHLSELNGNYMAAPGSLLSNRGTMNGPANMTFSAAFPEAPASSSAARIPVATNGLGVAKRGAADITPGAPGWGVVFSWLRADAASAAAQKVLCSAGMSSPKLSNFGRPVLKSSSPEPHVPACSQLVQSTRGRSQHIPDLPSSVDTNHSVICNAESTEATPPRPNSSSHNVNYPSKIRWIVCAPRFSSVWRYVQRSSAVSSQAADKNESCVAGASPDLCPNTPRRKDFAADDDMLVVQQRKQQRRPAVIGFVHAPHDPSLDGMMVTVTCAESSRQPRKQWGFFSEVHRGHGYLTCEEAIHAAEKLLLMQTALS